MKFAYLIMAHHRFDVLKLLLTDLDDERNDIFLHVDKKTGKYDKECLKQCITSAKLFFVDRIPVYWSDYSQILCELNLLKTAVSYGYHDYYHLLVGVEFPLKTQNEIHDFFEKNRGYEFIGYDVFDHAFLNKIKYYYWFGRYARSTTAIQRRLYKLCQTILMIQKKLKVNRIKGREDYFKKGYANWSITHSLAEYILANKESFKFYKKTSCADEIYLHTLVYHSDFYQKVFDPDDEYHSVMRKTTWTDPKNQYHMEDIDELLDSGRLFARKFDSEDAVDIIKKIIEKRTDKGTDHREL